MVFPEPPEGQLSETGLEFMQNLLACCPERRISAEAALEHPYFWKLPYALEPEMMPTFQETNSTGRSEKKPPPLPRSLSAPAGSIKPSAGLHSALKAPLMEAL